MMNSNGDILIVAEGPVESFALRKMLEEQPSDEVWRRNTFQTTEEVEGADVGPDVHAGADRRTLRRPDQCGDAGRAHRHGRGEPDARPRSRA